MKKTLAALLCFYFLNGFSQQWSRVDTLVLGAVKSFYFDSATNSLFVGGQYKRIGSDTIVGIGQYKNGQWNRMGDGVDWLKGFLCQNCIPNPVNSIIRYKDTIYITGDFSYSGNKTLNGIAKWDGTTWQNIGSGLTFTVSNPTSWGSGNKLKIINGELYLAGCFSYVNGVAANGLAKFNGTTWSAVHNLPKVDNTQNIVYDVELYNGELYAGGTMDNGSTIKDIVKWNGTAWINPGIGMYGWGYIRGITTYKNKLYVIGSYSKFDHPLNPGNCIVSYNGFNWENTGSGMLFNPNGLAWINSYYIYNNVMYLGGAFDLANGVKINGIATFDGDKFCSLDTTVNFNLGIDAINFYKDSLYIGGYLQNTQPPQKLYSLAKCKDYTNTDKCSGSVVGLKENNILNEVKIHPNPVKDKLFLEFAVNEIKRIRITNALGQLVIETQVTEAKNEIDLSFLNSGIYFLSFQNEQKQRTFKIIKE